MRRFSLVMAVFLTAAFLPSGAEAQKSFDVSKYRDLVSGLKSSSTPPAWAVAFKQQVERCWKKPFVKNGEAADVEAAFTIHLKIDGTLDGPPISDPPKGPITPFLQVYRESALRALIECQPYSLPADQFGQWKTFVPVFTEPRK